ncbi:MAG: hypothetical protein QOE82_1195 [Thermoanaerobaculia bacterium]|jgi:hypothetical protein|nr:hypothetical protein [Thermoanaerobaculia bacterium]
MENLLFLDSRDLRDCVERHDPCGASRLARDVAAKGYAVVLTFTTVLESISRRVDPDYIVTFMRRLEAIPHVFIPHTGIGLFEFKEAVIAFDERREPNHVLPRYTSWASYLSAAAPGPALAKDVLQQLDAVPLSEHVASWLRADADIEFGDHFRQRIAATVAQNREVLGSTRAGKAVFAQLVATELELNHLKVSDLTAFTRWLYSNPAVCPGWRLMQETFQEFRCDVGARVAKGDLPDLTHLLLVPYMRAATLDRKWREYVGRAKQKLAKQGLTMSYRLFENLADVRRHWRDPI